MKAPAVLLWLLVGCATATPRPISPTEVSPSVRPEGRSSGPTIHFKDDSGEVPVNPISSLMYFVKLISPEPVSMSESVGNTQQCRILAVDRRVESGKFTTRCQFEIIGEGTQQNLFDQTVAIRRNQDRLAEGGTLDLQLGFIKIKGAGQGDILVEGVMSDGRPIADRLSMLFNARGRRIPVTIGINDIRDIEGKPHAVNEVVIQVNSLDFRRQEGRPDMHVILASIKSSEADNGLLSNLMGKVRGAVANMFIPPVPIRAVGNDAMLDFAQAIVDGHSHFTFPTAE